MGCRGATQIFMPAVYVFPGGRVEGDDSLVPVAGALTLSERTKLASLGGAHKTVSPHALAAAGVRETFEETGLVIGGRLSASAVVPSQGTLPTWQTFFACGFLPRLDGLTAFARAITPPGHVRRYDTRFFTVGHEAIVHYGAGRDDEFSDLAWVTREDAYALPIAPVTRLILDDFWERQESPSSAVSSLSIFRQTRQGFTRRLLTLP